MYRVLRWLTFLALIPISGRAVEIYGNVPDMIRATEWYVIYSYGPSAQCVRSTQAPRNSSALPGIGLA
jgi:hypothetical protein